MTENILGFILIALGTILGNLLYDLFFKKGGKNE